MPHIQNDATASKPSVRVELSEIRRRLEESDTARRELLVLAFFSYSKDIDEIIRLLISKATPETLRTLEEILTTGSEG